MTPATPLLNEQARIDALHELHILDTISEKHYDDLVALAAYICKTPIALISLVDVDRQWFKSSLGIDTNETPRDVSFCSHAILTPDQIMEINDATSDERFHDNPLVTDKEMPVVFYAGVPIKTEKGHPLGTLCVIDNKPKKLNPKQRKALAGLANQVEALLKLYSLNKDLAVVHTQLKKHNELLQNFAGTVSHDMKMPLANLIVTSDLLMKKYINLLDDNGVQYLNYLKSSSLSLSDYITNILNHYESVSYNIDDRTSFDVNDLLENIIELINIRHHCDINLPEVNCTVHCNRVALEQIFLNLIGNSIKYNDKDETIIDLSVALEEDFYTFKVSDNGRGIPNDKLESIFDLFTTVGDCDREGKKGHGIGLSTVKQLVNSLGGTIDVASILGQGTTFTFTIAA